MVLFVPRIPLFFKPYLRLRGPGTIHLGIKGEVMLPPFERDPEELFGNRGINEADRRALVQDAGISRLAVRIAVQEPVGLVIREPESVLELLDGEVLDPHLCDRFEGCGFVPGLLGLLPPRVAGDGKEELPGIGEVLAGGHQATLVVFLPLVDEEQSMALD